jgi:RNA polymerase sigma-70 factor (sigma-E family)
VYQVTDESDFTAFVTARYSALVRTAYLLVGDRGRAEDLVQSALYRCYRRWEQVRAPEAAEAYVRTAMVRLAGRWSRRRWRGEQPSDLSTRDEPARTGPDPDTAIDTARALATLTPAQRAVLVLRYFDDLTEARTAELLGCSIGTVKSRANRGLAALRAAGVLGPQPEPSDDDSDSEVRHG